MFTLNDLVRWRAELHPDVVALVDERGDQATYQELHERSLASAQGWVASGVVPGDVVALLDKNSVAFMVNLLGISRAGAIAALMNWRLTSTENKQIFALIEPCAVVASPALMDRLPSDLPPLRVSLGPAPEGWIADEAAGGGENVTLPDSPTAVDTAALAFSSGTTGLPKAIPWRHESLVRSAMVDSAECRGMHVGAAQLMVAPTFHLAGLANLLMGLANGATVHLRAGFDPELTLDEIAELKIAYMTAVPAMFRALVHAAADRDDAVDTSSMEEMTYGASPISAELLREIEVLFPTTRLRQFYGMTEICGALTTLTPADHRSDRHVMSAGRVNPGFEVKLVEQDGCEVADGAPGELMIRGHTLMTDYWRNQQATAEAFRDGWFASGDIAIRDEGYLTIMGRAKDMIITGGENVDAAEVEATVDELPSVADVAVIGLPDERFGERVHAVVVLHISSNLDLDELQAFCRTRLAGYKIPRSLDIVESLPRNATGKVLKRDLRKSYLA